MANGEKFQSRAVTLTQIRKCLMTELSPDIFICYDIFEFQVPRLPFFESLYLQTHRQMDTHTHTQKHADEYSIVEVDKLQL